MYEHILTVGFFDKDTCQQEIETGAAKNILCDMLIGGGVYAFTMLDCVGVYRMQSTGEIVREPSLRVEIASDNQMTEEEAKILIEKIKSVFNQESVMYKTVHSAIEFI